MLEFQRSAFPSTIEISYETCKNGGLIQGNSTQFHQVIMNLCTNALHAMEGKVGTLEVRLERTELTEDDLIQEPNHSPGGFLTLSVSDTGTGLPPELLDKIFDPYFTTKEMGKGSGMGLAVVHGIVNNHGGFIRVESELGKGSTFKIFFPRIDKEYLEEQIHKTGPLPTGTENILFIDDEEMLADLGKTRLEKLGYSVTALTDSSEALKIFQKNPAHFDLIITDQTMPNLTGSDLANQMLQIRPTIPIILCTGFSEMVDKIKAEDLGIKGFLMKPFNDSDLAKIVDSCLKG